MTAAIPFGDPQFWLVTAIAVVALGFVLRRIVRVRRKGELELPCDSCPSGQGRTTPAWIRRLRGTRTTKLALAGLALAAAANGAGTAMVERRVAAMGSTLSVRVEADDRGVALALSEAAIAAVAEAERALSTWRDDSELARFNDAAAGSVVEFSPLAAAALDTALDCQGESDGAFDPTIAPLVAAWGLRSGGREPGESEIDAAKARLDAATLRSDRGALRRRQPGGVQIEEGGFGKGAGLDLALDRVEALSSGAAAELDFGGQIAWTGRKAPIVIRLADPRDRTSEVLELAIDAARGSVATSGNSERGIVVAGERQGHLLDPRTGRPAPDFGSATVFAPSAAIADCRATALFVLGPERGARWLVERAAGESGRREGALLVIEEGGLRALLTPGLAVGARALAAGVEIQVLQSVS